MLIRNLQMISNTFKFKEQGIDSALGDYCVFGPFDAMNIETESTKWNIGENQQDIWEVASEKTLNCCDGKSSRCNVFCVFQESDKEKEETFVQNLEKEPFLFVSFILLKHIGIEKISAEAQSVIQSINSQGKFRAYLSLGKNEIVLLHCCHSYVDGLTEILKKHEEFKAVSKSSTVFAVREDALSRDSDIFKKIDEKEKVHCRLRGIMKERDKAETFLMTLGECIVKEGIDTSIRWYDVLGEVDIVVEIDNVLLKDLLPFYKSGEYMTHMCSEYQDAWYNIATEFLSERKSGGYEIGTVQKNTEKGLEGSNNDSA